jgi:hypothetical protein
MIADFAASIRFWMDAEVSLIATGRNARRNLGGRSGNRVVPAGV